jgi:hypothetical protein
MAEAVNSLAASPFAVLDDCESLRLVTDVVHDDDVLFLAQVALTCRRGSWQAGNVTVIPSTRIVSPGIGHADLLSVA